MIYISMELYRVYGDKQYNMHIACITRWVCFMGQTLPAIFF